MEAVNGVSYATFKAGEVEAMTGMSQSRQRLEQASGHLKAPPVFNNKAMFTIEHIAERALFGALIDANAILVRREPAFAKYFEQARQHVQQWALLAPGAVDDPQQDFLATPLGRKPQPQLEDRPATVAEYAAHMRHPFRFALVWGGSFCTFSPDLRELTKPEAKVGEEVDLVSEMGRTSFPVCMVIDLKFLGDHIAASAGRPLAIFKRHSAKAAS